MGRVEGSLVVCEPMRAGAPLATAARSVAGALHPLRRRPRARPPTVDPGHPGADARCRSGVPDRRQRAADVAQPARRRRDGDLAAGDLDRLAGRPAAHRDPGRDHRAARARSLHRLAPLRARSRSPPATSRRASPGASAPCIRPRAGTWSRCSRSASCCRWSASPRWPTRRRKPGLFALGAMTVLFASIESAGLKHLWWHVQ